MISLYLKAQTNILLVGKNKKQNAKPPDDGKVQLDCGSAIMNESFDIEGYSWNGAITISITTLKPMQE